MGRHEADAADISFHVVKEVESEWEDAPRGHSSDGKQDGHGQRPMITSEKVD